MNSRRVDGRYEYEVEPGRWVSRQRVHQLGLSTPRQAQSKAEQRLRQSAYQRTRRQTRITRGLCGECGHEPLASQSMCAGCLARTAKRVRLYRGTL